MIPRWKLRREIANLGEHLWAFAGLFYEPILKISHDRWRRELDEPPNLGVELGKKVAIVLVYQPDGIPASMIATLSHLVDHGYAPLIVANTSLSVKDRERLAQIVWRIVERPNWGYDFGGYRDGVLLLDQWGLQPERLMILNDSIWFPLTHESELLDRLEAAEGDVVGTLMHESVLRKRTRTRRPAFLESYLYLVNRTGLENPAFLRFWRSYRVSSNKLNAIKRGERGFTPAMQRAGLSVVGLFSQTRFLEVAKSFSARELRCTLRYAAYTDPSLASQGQAVLSSYRDDSQWIDLALTHITETALRRRFSSSFPQPCIAVLGMDYLKKSLGPRGAGQMSLHQQTRLRYLDAVRSGHLPATIGEVLEEIEASVPENAA